MMLDSLALSASQALTSTAPSTNCYDTGVTQGVARQLGIGEPIVILLHTHVPADFTSGDESYSVTVQVADDSAFTSPTSLGTYAFAASQLTPARDQTIGLPRTGWKRFLRLNYTLGGTTPSWTVSAYVQPANMLQGDVRYPFSSTISG